jgi:hypothetical protein
MNGVVLFMLMLLLAVLNSLDCGRLIIQKSCGCQQHPRIILNNEKAWQLLPRQAGYSQESGLKIRGIGLAGWTAGGGVRVDDFWRQ